MQTVVTSPTQAQPFVSEVADGAKSNASAYQGYQIIRRNGAVVVFAPNKIAVALMKAFLAVHGTQGAASASVRETVEGLTEAVVRALLRSRPGGGNTTGIQYRTRTNRTYSTSPPDCATPGRA
mgnify:CR=1 FL=1